MNPIDDLITRIEQLTTEREDLRKALEAVIEDLQETVQYAPEYFRDKWDLGSSLPLARAILGKA
jgi:hypothetical protein